MVAILMMSAKMATSGLLKIKVFLKVMTSKFWFVTLPTKFCYVTQIIL